MAPGDQTQVVGTGSQSLCLPTDPAVGILRIINLGFRSSQASRVPIYYPPVSLHFTCEQVCTSRDVQGSWAGHPY